MRFFRSKKKAPDERLLGKWLFNNDVEMLDQMLRDATANLFHGIVQSDVIERANGQVFTSSERDFVAGYATQLLDGGFILPSFRRKPEMTAPMVKGAEQSRDLILAEGPGPIYAAALTTGLMMAIRAFYTDFETSVLMATHVISQYGDVASEAYRVRGLAHFANGNIPEAKVDLEHAYRIAPQLINLKEPLAAVHAILEQL